MQPGRNEQFNMTQTDSKRWTPTISRSLSVGFTSLELLVVIAVCVVLSAILLPALARTKERDIRVVCVNNEKQLYTSLQIYCDDNGDKLPQLQGAGSWCWDMPTSATTPMTNSGCTQKTFYCPSTAPRFTDQQNWAEANSLWNFGPNTGSQYNLTGYAFALGGSSSRVDPQYRDLTLLTELHTNGLTIVADTPGTREVIADVILSANNSLPAMAADNFYAISGGFTQNGITYPHLSAHLGRGQVPAGGNIAYKDGHVQWRKFDASSFSANNNQTKVRTAGTSLYFWW
jgi:type II secretory pathway pseudopilin PulG